jgi:nucleoid-associated protein YgaU
MPTSESILCAVERICPFLALSTDHRTAIDGFDPEHACHAHDPPDLLERSRQVELCLGEAHRQCDRYVAFLSQHAALAAAVPTPSSDAHIARTRLVFDPDPRFGSAAALIAPGTSARRWLVAGGVAAVGVAAAATAVGGGFNGLVGGPSPSPDESSPAITIDASPSMRLQATAQPTQQPTDEPTGLPPSPTPSATRLPTEAPASEAPQTYTVKQGDTLSAIATRFGTSVSAIQAANGLDSDVINVGQELVIP